MNIEITDTAHSSVQGLSIHTPSYLGALQATAKAFMTEGLFLFTVFF